MQPERPRPSDEHGLFHGHHPACPYTIEGDWSVCDCGAGQPSVERLHAAVEATLRREDLCDQTDGEHHTDEFVALFMIALDVEMQAPALDRLPVVGICRWRFKSGWAKHEQCGADAWYSVAGEPRCGSHVRLLADR